MAFKIFYDDGTTYTGEPENAPVLGALIIVEDDKNHGRQIICKGDYFCWDDRGNGLHWWEADFIGLVDYLIRPGMKRVLIGRLVSEETWSEVYNRALNDPDFKPKTAYSLRNHNRTV